MEHIAIEECCDILDSRRIPITASDRMSGPYPYYGANGVQDYVADYIFDDELVLLAEDGGNFGSKTRPIAYRVSGKCWVNNHAHVLKPMASMDVDYLCYSLMFYDTGELVNGATRQKLTQTAMRKMLIPQRSLQEQKRIVCELSKVQSIISARQQQLQKLDELIKARFVEMFGEPKSNKSNLVKIGEIGSLTSGGTPSRIKPEYFKGDIRWYSAGELNSLYLPDSVEHISKTALKESAAKLFNKGTLMIGMYDTAAFKLGILTEDSSSNQACANLNPQNDYNVVWLYYLFDIMKPVFLQERQGVRQKNLSLSKIKEFEVPSAPIGIQNQFAAFVERVNKSKAAAQKALDEAQLLFDSLMQKYFE